MSSFHERQKSLFNHLKDAEDQCGFSQTNNAPAEDDYGIIDSHSYRRLKREMKQFRGKESIFKKSQASIQNCLKYRNTPAHIKDPQNWSYYSLADVTPDQMSDATNVATARTFLKEMEQREMGLNKMDEENEDDALFKKPKFCVSSTIKVSTEVNKSNDIKKPIYKDRKLIMPEYVVGHSKPLNKKNIILKKTESENPDCEKKVELKLNHLYEEDNLDDEE